MENEIIEGNLLIVKFMGRDTSPIERQNLKYHSSWDYLMPVILKISEYQYTDESWKENPVPFYDYAWPRTFGMRNENGYYMFRFNANTLFTDVSLIKAAWLAVTDFIKSQNEN